MLILDAVHIVTDLLQYGGEQVATNAVHGGVRDRDSRSLSGIADGIGNEGNVCVDLFSAEIFQTTRQACVDGFGPRQARHGCLNHRCISRHQLAAVCGVDLVTVIGRRVVTCRHHHARCGVACTDDERNHRRGYRTSEESRDVPRFGEHAGGDVGEVFAPVSSVTSNDQRRVSGKPLGNRHGSQLDLLHVHTQRTFAQGPAKPGCPKREAISH